MKLDIYIKWWLESTVLGDSTNPADTWDLVDFLSDLVLPQFIFLLKVILVSAVSLNILQVIFGVALIA